MYNVVFTKMFKWEKAELLPWVGWSKNINEYRILVNKDNKILLSGNYMGMLFTEDVVETGKWVSETIIKFG